MFERFHPILTAFADIHAASVASDDSGLATAPVLPGRRLRRPDWALASAAAIAFSLAFFGGGLALLFSLMPPSSVAFPAIDLGVLVLMVPLCALSLTIVLEVLRAAVLGLPRVQPPRLAPALSDWRPGRGEG